jgi:hypothetical protein
MAIACLAVQGQDKNVTILAQSNGVWMPMPSTAFDKKTKKTIAIWPRTEKDDWFEPSGLVVDNVPTVNSFADVFPEWVNFVPDNEDQYTPMPWRLTEENGETVLHCYLKMPADIVDNFWLTDEEGCLLDKETGISYRARRTEPDCYYKRFAFKGKKGAVADFKIFFPKLPETTKKVAIYGVPNWQLRGREVVINRQPSGLVFHGVAQYYDNVPKFHHPTQIVEAKDYDKDNFFTWSEYKDAHLIKPIPEGTMAMWLTPNATYVAVATEMNWRREYFGRGGNTILIDKQGHQYKCKGVMDYPDDTLFWVQGMSGDYFAIVLIFEPLPLSLETITYIVPEGEPFKANFANWSGEVRPDLSIKELRQNQRLFDYHPRVVVE